jgi:hypothetical protein
MREKIFPCYGGGMQLMLDNRSDVQKIVSSLIRYFESEGNLNIVEILKHSFSSSECIDYDNWKVGTYIYLLLFEIEIEFYIRHRVLLPNYEKEILDAANLFLRGESNEQIGEVIVRPVRKQYLDWSAIAGIANKKDVLSAIDQIKNIMIAVSTGGPRIQVKNAKYMACYESLDKWLDKLGLENPNSYRDLWEWYGRWKQGDLPSYSSRRTFVSEMYASTIELIEKSTEGNGEHEYIPTGWDRVDRTVYEMKKRLVEANNEEQYQAIGMLGREVIITIGQQVFDKNVHKTEDGTVPGKADAKRMLDAYFNHELGGQSNELIRKYAKASLDLANHVTHDRLATARDSSICLISVISLANTVKIISRSPELRL